MPNFIAGGHVKGHFATSINLGYSATKNSYFISGLLIEASATCRFLFHTFRRISTVKVALSTDL